MKIHNILLLTIPAALNAQTTIVHELGTLNDQAQDLSLAFSAGDYAPTSPLTTADALFTFSDQTIGTETFSYTVTMTAGANLTDLGQSLGGLGDVGSTGGTFQDGDVLTIEVAVTDNVNVVFDGFVNFGLNFNGTGDGFNIAGIDYIRGTATNGDSDPRHGIAISGGILASSSADITFIASSGTPGDDSNILRGIAYQFSTVPEPASAALIGSLFALGFVCTRRKR